MKASTTDTNTLKKAVISAFVSLILVLQFMPIATKFTAAPWGGWYWPFIDYPMYFGSHKEGEHVNIGYPLILTTKSGEAIKLSYTDHDLLGLNYFKYQEICHQMLRAKDHTNAVDKFLSLYPNSHEVTKIEIFSYPVIVTRQGPKTVTETLLKTIYLDTNQG